MQWNLQVSILIHQLLHLWQTNTKRSLIAAIIERIIHIIESEVKRRTILHHTQWDRYCTTRTQQIDLAVWCSIFNITIRILFSLRLHIDFMSFTQGKLFLADGDYVAGCCVQLIFLSFTIKIPEEINISQCYLTTITRVRCSQLSLDFNLIVVSFIARNLIIRYDITMSISNDWMLANHFEPVTI